MGRTIGPKYGTEWLFGSGLFNLCVKCLLGMLWAGNGRGFRVY